MYEELHPGPRFLSVTTSVMGSVRMTANPEGQKEILIRMTSEREQVHIDARNLEDGEGQRACLWAPPPFSSLLPLFPWPILVGLLAFLPASEQHPFRLRCRGTALVSQSIWIAF